MTFCHASSALLPSRPMDRAGIIVLLCLTLLLPGCRGEVGDSSGLATDVREALDERSMEEQDRFLAVRQIQDQALRATVAVRQAPDSASVDDLEAALVTLNQALLKGRGEITMLRSDGLDFNHPLWRELREANREIVEAYEFLVSHHPDPTPSLMKSGDEDVPGDTPES